MFKWGEDMNVYITRINGISFDNVDQYKQHMVTGIAHQLGIREMGIYHYDSSGESDESLNARVDGIIAGINWGDLIICQFPTGNGLKFEWALVDHLKVYGGRIAIFIHDLEPLHYEEKQYILSETVDLYNQAEVLIVPSFSMRQFLLDKGIKKSTKFVVQEMWDFCIQHSFFHVPILKREITFINKKLEGMHEWNSEVVLKDYEDFSRTDEKAQKADGLVLNESIVELSKGGFGLVWYKDTYECEYMKYGISFSMSKFLVTGIPVIVPSGISNQSLIEKNHLGVIVNSLSEAASVVERINETEYKEYTQSISEFSPALCKGFYIKKCLIDVMQAFFRKDVHFSIPNKVYSLEKSLFSRVILKESYGGNFALSWSFIGNADGFLIYDSDKVLVHETNNAYQHYYLIKKPNNGSGFIIKAYVETLKGKAVIAESKLTYLDMRKYESPKVSLIIPVYNAENHIIRGIDTAIAQSFDDLEVILIDDGSEDKTSEILDWYAEKYNNIVVIHQTNGGPALARNTGIKKANGEYLGFMDSDDMIYPDRIEKLYESIKKNNCDVVVSPAYWIKESEYKVFIQYAMVEDTVLTFDEFFKLHYIEECGYGDVVWNKMYRTSIIKEHLFPILLAEDAAWTPYILSYANGICYLNDYSYEYDRNSRDSTLADKVNNKSREELFAINKEGIMFYMHNGNQRKIKLLKELAKKRLLEKERFFPHEGYMELWEQIDKSF